MGKTWDKYKKRYGADDDIRNRKKLMQNLSIFSLMKIDSLKEKARKILVAVFVRIVGMNHLIAKGVKFYKACMAIQNRMMVQTKLRYQKVKVMEYYW